MFNPRSPAPEAGFIDSGPFAVQYLRDLGRFAIAVLCRDKQMTPAMREVVRRKGYGHVIDFARERGPEEAVRVYRDGLSVSISQLAQADPDGVARGSYFCMRTGVGPSGAFLSVEPHEDILAKMPDASSGEPVCPAFEASKEARERWRRERDALFAP